MRKKIAIALWEAFIWVMLLSWFGTCAYVAINADKL